MSIRKLLIASRYSGPAIEYVTELDGSRTITKVREARPPNRSSRLSREEELCILLQTGVVPVQFLPPGHCGVQANDNDPRHLPIPTQEDDPMLYDDNEDEEMRSDLAEYGIMEGRVDSNRA